MPDFYLQPCDSEGPVFKAPWEAQAFALVLALHEAGLFSWVEWAGALHRAIDAAQRRGDPDLGDSYYVHWLGALEALVREKGITTELEIARRKSQWLSAYLHTPHGEPIALNNARAMEPDN